MLISVNAAAFLKQFLRERFGFGEILLSISSDARDIQMRPAYLGGPLPVLFAE